MQLIAFIIIYPFLWIISILPFKILYIFSDILYFWVYLVFGYRKKVVRTNLSLCFPEKSEKERKEIEKKFYKHLCDMLVESIKSLTISETEMKKRFVCTNIEAIHNIEKQNRSIVIMCAHYASWEWVFILQVYVKYKGYAVYKKLANKYFDKMVKKIRARYNSYLITNKETVEVLTQQKEKGELTLNGFISDQSPKYQKAHHWRKFMGIVVPMHTGAEVLAKKLDMSVLFMKVKKVKRGYYEATFSTIANNPNDYKNYEITDIFFDKVEAQIREIPEHYLWTHKRWKHRDKVPKEFQ